MKNLHILHPRLKNLHLKPPKHRSNSNEHLRISKLHAHTDPMTPTKIHEVSGQGTLPIRPLRVVQPSIRAKLGALGEESLVAGGRVRGHADFCAWGDGPFAVGGRDGGCASQALGYSTRYAKACCVSVESKMNGVLVDLLSSTTALRNGSL